MSSCDWNDTTKSCLLPHSFDDLGSMIGCAVTLCVLVIAMAVAWLKMRKVLPSPSLHTPLTFTLHRSSLQSSLAFRR